MSQKPIEEEPYPSAGYAWYVVGVLTLVYVFSFIDRQILNLLVRPIRRDLGITDTQMSLLMGFSFALFYTFFGIPLGRLADSRSRRTIIAVGFAAWSLFTAGCGLARNFFQMLLMRVGVGVGEAALSPAAYSLITDYFPKQRLATAISVYSMGIYIGGGLALVLGAVVANIASAQETWLLPIVGETRPWQVIFFIVGLPGVVLALLLYTVKEPKRRGVKQGSAQVPLGEVLSYLWKNKVTFLCHNVGFALISFSNYGSSSWVPTFFQRNHGWSAADAGYVYGGIIAIFGTLGIVAGGRLADYMTQRGYRDSSMRVGLYVTLAWLPTCVYSLVPSGRWAALLLIPAVFLTSAPFGVAAAAIQQMMPNPMRGQASAIYLFVVNLIGLGIGPTAVAVTTDYVFGYDDAVRYSLFIVSLFAHIVAAVLLWIGLKPYCTSLDRLSDWNAQQTEKR
ncbi:MAG: MFS transporter [Acidobacteria bacterium]|nr:MFS transporter [Acidobacteriota bacterium]MCW5967437.1 MFS transporter [Blastocatellales bacterium]